MREEKSWLVAKLSKKINFIFAAQFAALAIRDQALLQKMYALYDRDKEQSETIYMVVNFFSYVVKLPGKKISPDPNLTSAINLQISQSSINYYYNNVHWYSYLMLSALPPRNFI